jgi:undecaprenyl diphosphate synthase
MITQLQGVHVAVIMDGNGRWAQARGKPRSFGHRAGAAAVRRTVEAARQMGIGTLTLYAFSSDNWRRPPKEVAVLMRLFRSYLAGETARCVENGIRIRFLGRRDRLPEVLVRAMVAAELATAECTGMLLRVAIDYSARDSIVAAAGLTSGEPATRESFARLLAAVNHEPEPAPEVDLLIRTGGEQRISDFLLWEVAYAELVFTPRMWPDYAASDLESAIRDYFSRERRFGAVPSAAAV